MTRDLVIGLDSSTTATKAIAWDRHGHAVGEGRAPIALANPQAGWFEQQADDWRASARTAIRELITKVKPERIAAIAISNQRESFAQFDKDGKALRPATLWLDERGRSEIERLSARLGRHEIHRISGKPVDMTPCLYRCAWFDAHMKEMWAKTSKTAEVHGVLVHHLTGQWVTSTASADPMGLLDMQAQDWSDTLIEAVGLTRAQLPRLARPGQRIAMLTKAAAEATGLPQDVSVVAGGGDGQCAGSGANVFAEGRAYLNLGTAVVSGSFGKTYAHDPAFRTMNAMAETGYIYESCLRTGTFLINWLVEQLFTVDPAKNPQIFKTLEAEAAQSPIGAHGLALVPYWSGCMTPYWDANARGVLAGLSASHRRGDVYRAILEGIALEQAMVTGRIARATRPIDHYVAIGGGAASDLWCQIIADASGREVRRSTTVEASSLGAAVAAATGAGWYKSVTEAAGAMAGALTRTFTPEARAHARYQELAAIYADLWPSLSKWNERMAAFAQGGA
ncbi:FGGY-family carbohydrate kinase [Taklimakanibacter lacteus]|uniref:FGGY-family carbohydrate kinase n=1 Tax=Taklimakanibacter lacteus TaxID=2268456 RepID=UPI000E66BE38